MAKCGMGWSDVWSRDCRAKEAAADKGAAAAKAADGAQPRADEGHDQRPGRKAALFCPRGLWGN